MELVLYIAMSAGGRIANLEGKLDFLTPYNHHELDLIYKNFYESIDTIIMGERTYTQIKNELSPDAWPYANKKVYVYTNRKDLEDENVEFTSIDPEKLTKLLELKGSKRVFLLGGAETIKHFVEKNLIDRYQIYIVPVIIGKGISLFKTDKYPVELELESARRVGKVAEIIYRKKRSTLSTV